MGGRPRGFEWERGEGMEGRSPRGLRQADDTSGSQSYDPTISSYDWILLATFFATSFFPLLSTPPFYPPPSLLSHSSRAENTSLPSTPRPTFQRWRFLPSFFPRSIQKFLATTHASTPPLSLSLLHKSKPYLNDNLCSFFVILYTRERRWRTYSLSSGWKSGQVDFATI